MRLSGMDLNLLVALDALLDERSVTRAAQRVGLSQPAMSNALRRLRESLDDELLVRSGGGMVPTARALELEGPVRDALRSLDDALRAPRDFDPATTDRVFTVATTDYSELVLLPQLADQLARRAPGARLHARSMGRGSPWSELESGQLDLALGVSTDLPSGLYRKALFRDRFVCLLRSGHPRVGESGLDLELYTDLDHVLVAPGGREGGVVDRALEKLGLSRRVAVQVPHFLTAPMVVARTDAVLTVASRVACRLAGPLGLSVFRPPLELPRFTVSQFWHGRAHSDAAHSWLRALVAEVAASDEVSLNFCDQEAAP